MLTPGSLLSQPGKISRLRQSESLGLDPNIHDTQLIYPVILHSCTGYRNLNLYTRKSPRVRTRLQRILPYPRYRRLNPRSPDHPATEHHSCIQHTSLLHPIWRILILPLLLRTRFPTAGVRQLHRNHELRCLSGV